MMRLLFPALLALATAVASPLARAWDPAGHMLVGQIAWEKTDPAIRERIDKVVALLPNQYNLEHPYNFVTAECWMDDMRSLPGYAWSKWHYVDMTWTPDASAFFVPAGVNVITEITECSQKLAAGGLSDEDLAQRVAMLVHLVGDIHQPLHVTSRNSDKGGNIYLITGVPFTDLWPGTHPNLHTFWDKAFRFEARASEIVEQWPSPLLADRPVHPGEGIIATEASRLMQSFPERSFGAGELDGKVDDWAHESYLLSCKAAYPPGEPPGDAAVGTLPPNFVNQAHAIAQRRVVQAGYRVAKALNRLVPPATPPQ